MAASPIVRLRDFLADSGLNHAAAALLFKCSQPTISRVIAGVRGVGVGLGTGIQKATKGWRGGQIMVSEWDGYKPARLAKPAKSRAA